MWCHTPLVVLYGYLSSNERMKIKKEIAVGVVETCDECDKMEPHERYKKARQQKGDEKNNIFSEPYSKGETKDDESGIYLHP